jgi:uncharacterized protein
MRCKIDIIWFDLLTMEKEYLLSQLQTFYKTLEKETTRLEKTHAERLQCKKGCAACCVDDITIFSIEAENIKTKNKAFFAKESPHALGKCAFLDQNEGCRIYKTRPYVCRTQGLPLRWIQEKIEYRDICPLNENDEPVEEIPSQHCFTFENYEEQLAILQIKFDGGSLERTMLRDLFYSQTNT